ncbi:MAG TPA: PGPGW domain-containing protein [Alphaproteobacteria bacterium]
MHDLKRRIYIGLGVTLIVAGVVIAPLPGPGGLPVMAAGAFVVLRHSAGARRIYVRVKRRWPRPVALFDRFRRRHRRVQVNP